MQVWHERTFRATVVLLIGSAVLIAPGVAGFDSSWLFIGLLVVGAGALAGFRPLFTALPDVGDQNLGTYGRDLWLAPLVAAVVLAVVAPDASAAELQALGGVVGFVGMVNYFIRPVYLLMFGFVYRLVSPAEPAPPDSDETTDPLAGDDQRTADESKTSSPLADESLRTPGEESRKHPDSTGRPGEQQSSDQSTQSGDRNASRTATDRR